MWKDTDHFKNKGGKKKKIQPISLITVIQFPQNSCKIF